MPRVKRGTNHVKKRKKLLSRVKGYKWGRKKLIKAAKIAAVKAGVNSYRDRKKKKRVMRGLMNIRISAFVKEHGLSYSRFIDALKKENISLDRKVLSELAINNKEILAGIISQIKK